MRSSEILDPFNKASSHSDHFIWLHPNNSIFELGIPTRVFHKTFKIIFNHKTATKKLV